MLTISSIFGDCDDVGNDQGKKVWDVKTSKQVGKRDMIIDLVQSEGDERSECKSIRGFVPASRPVHAIETIYGTQERFSSSRPPQYLVPPHPHF